MLGLGAGGNSRLGFAIGQTEEHAMEVVQAALDLGVTLIDTARGYHRAGRGKVLKGRRRQEVVLSSKSPYLDEKACSRQAFTKT
jgi:aryl-alcohol dehydrogenase-like predicted oxidoreductase